MVPELSGFERFLLAFSAFLKIWFNRPFAEAVWAVKHGAAPQLPGAAEQAMRAHLRSVIEAFRALSAAALP